MKIKRGSKLWKIGWWTRWWVRYFPVLAYVRLRYCRKQGHGPMYDAIVCFNCGAPWFKNPFAEEDKRIEEEVKAKWTKTRGQT